MLKRRIFEISVQWKIKPLQKKIPNRDSKSLIKPFCTITCSTTVSQHIIAVRTHNTSSTYILNHEEKYPKMYRRNCCT